MKMSQKMTRLFLFAVAALLVLTVAMSANAEVRLIVSKNMVKVNDPALGQPSILNDFQANGHRTHNNMALVWNSDSVWVYDIRTHQWLNQQNFSAVSGLLSDELALAWEPRRVTVFSAPQKTWVVSDQMTTPITGQMLSGQMAAVTCEDAFVVYDPVLKTWQKAGDFNVEDAEIGENLAVAWDANDAVIYDLTLHQWVMKQGIAPQACIVEPYKVSFYSSSTIYTYDAMSHRWSETPR